MSNIKLYYTATSCGAANFITASLGEVKFDSEQVDLRTHKTQSGRDFYEINPKGNVPTVVLQDGTILNENVATLTYLADQGNANLAPKAGTADRYKYLNALSFVATELHKGVGALFYAQGEAKEAAKVVALKKIDLLVGLIGNQKYFLGENLSAADIYAYIVLTWTGYLGIPLTAEATAFKDRVAALEGVQKAHAAMNAAAAQPSKPRITLKYWGGRGLMEVPRAVLAISGKFPPADYTDSRFDAPPEGLTANLGRLPVLTVGDVTIGQSSAINYYVASEAGLLGSNAAETAQILSIGAHVQELREAYGKLVPYGTDPSDETLNTWFDGGAKDVSGTAERAGYSTRFLHWWMGRIEAALGEQGFAVGNKLSLADVQLYNTFAEVLREEEAAPGTPAAKREPFRSKARTDALLAKHPKLSQSVAAVAANANFQKWLATRGKQGF